MPFCKWQNYGDNKKINGCQEFEGSEGEMNTQIQKFLRAVKIL